MPNIQYEEESVKKERRFPKLGLPHLNLGGFGKAIAIVVVLILLNLASAVAAGILSAFSSNIDVTGVSVAFDPLITIAYLILYYSFAHFYHLNGRQSYMYLLLTILLSFTIPFIQGAIILLVLAPLLQKLHLIESNDPKSSG